jgi:fucose permease
MASWKCKNAALLNYLHAFYGTGALLGPVIASAILAMRWGIIANDAIVSFSFFMFALLFLKILLKYAAHLRARTVEKHPLINLGYSEETTGFL